ncbi:hypothetical protein [Micromonospora sp. SL4-19]
MFVKSGLVLAFHVLVACHDTPRSRRIRRIVSTLIAATQPASIR